MEIKFLQNYKKIYISKVLISLENECGFNNYFTIVASFTRSFNETTSNSDRIHLISSITGGKDLEIDYIKFDLSLKKLLCLKKKMIVIFIIL